MYVNNIPYYNQNMYNYTYDNQNTRKPLPPQNRPIGPGGFLLPFALGFATSPLILGQGPRPPFPPPYYGPVPNYYPRPYYPYY